MNRWIALAATAFVVGCHPAETPHGGGASAIDIAQLEASRGPGIPRLVTLARDRDALAIRALGRVGGKTARDALVALLPDPHAASALGIACSLDEPDAPTQAALGAALTGASPETIEALGRCGDATSVPRLVAALPSPTAALALGRFGRRKLAITADARAALALATAAPDRALRYAATYALAREFKPPAADADRATVDALKTRLGDPDAEIRAIAVAALGRRAALADPGDAAAVITMLRDPDWRVVAEAARALVDEHGAPDSPSAAVFGLATSDAPHAILEALADLPKLVASDRGPRELPATPFTGVSDPLVRGWITCRSAALRALMAHALSSFAAEPCTGLPAAYRDGLLGELAAEPTMDTSDIRAESAIALLAKRDRRATLAALTIIGSLAGNALVPALAELVASSDPVIASGAIDAVSSRTDLAAHPQLAAALAARAATETAPDLLAQLFDAIAKAKLDPAPCKRGLALHPVAAAAAAKCLGGGVAPPADPPALAAPPAEIDPANVIGKHFRWHVVTTRGEIVIALHPDVAPWAVAMIVALTRKGFYDNLDFHRVVADFVVQGGDPTMTGAGGPGFVLPAEPGGAFATGGVGIADSGRDTGSSQWFIMHSRAPHLDGRYTWFGVVESGQKSADALQIGDRVVHATIEELPPPAR